MINWVLTILNFKNGLIWFFLKQLSYRIFFLQKTHHLVVWEACTRKTMCILTPYHPNERSLRPQLAANIVCKVQIQTDSGLLRLVIGFVPCKIVLICFHSLQGSFIFRWDNSSLGSTCCITPSSRNPHLNLSRCFRVESDKQKYFKLFIKPGLVRFM